MKKSMLCTACELECALEQVLFDVLDQDEEAYGYWYPVTNLEINNEH